MTSGQGDVIFSPESTVTSLLASSGHLRGTLSDPDLSLTCIRYRDRDYESATEALEAYIADFDRSLDTSETSTGRPQIQKILITSAPLRTELRNKDVLRERLTDKELDLLYLPVVSGRCRDSDCLSLTTDDLLVLPSDGSLPVTRTSAFLTQSGDYPLGQSSHSNSWSSGRLRPNRSSHIKHCLHYSAPHNTPHKLYQSRAGTRAGKTQKTEPFTGLRSSGPRVKGSLRPQPQHGLYHQTPGPEVNQRDLPPPDSPGPSSPHHNYPRWLTSQKSEMDFSGVTSIPDLKYPAWLQECDNVPKYIPTTSIDLSESRKKTQHRVWGPTQTLPPSPRPPSWLGKLEASYEELRKGQKDSNGGHLEDVSGSDDDRQQLLRGEADHKTLRELRLQFAERLALAAEEERSTDFDKLFRDDKIESLILKAEKALDSPSLGLKTNTQLQNSPSLGLTSQLQNSPSLGLTSQLQNSPSLGLTSQMQNSPSLGLTSQLQNSPSLGLTSQLQNSPSLGLTSQLQNSPSLGLTSQLQNSPSLGLTSQLQNSPSLGLTSQLQNSPSLGLTSQLQNSPSLGLTSQLQKDMGHSPGGSEDVLEADRSWDNPAVTFKSPVPIEGAEDPLITTEPLRHRKDEAASGSCSLGYSSRKHPGPVEALKQMLFSLQAVEQQVSLENDSTPYQAPTLENDTKPLIKMSDDYDTSLGGQSLQRALHHLGKLKSLVEDSPGGKERQEGKTRRRPDISL